MKCGAEIIFNFTVKVPDIEAETPEAAETYIRAALEDGAPWLIELAMKAKWDVESVDIWPQDDTACEHTCEGENHPNTMLGSTPIAHCNRCPACSRRIIHGEINTHIRQCHSN